MGCVDVAGSVEQQGVLRMLVVNFAMADTGWRHFISGSGFAQRFTEAIRLLIGEHQPYDVVLPAQLGLASCFGQPVWITDDQPAFAREFINKAELDKQCQPPPDPTPEEFEGELNRMF